MTTWRTERLRSAKRIIRAALQTTSDEKLQEMLAAARSRQMPYSSGRVCFATRLYGYEARLASCPFYREAEDAYLRLFVATRPFCEAQRQRIVSSIIKGQIRLRGASDRRKVAAYFAAAEDQAWFWLSPSRRKAIEQAFVAEEQKAGEYLGARK